MSDKTCAVCAGKKNIPGHYPVIESPWEELVFCSCCSQYNKIPIPLPCLFHGLGVEIVNKTGSNAQLVKEYRESNQ
jgi:hypothetical protein